MLFLVSADFVASNYCYGIEMSAALEKHRTGKAKAIPVILSPCLWKETPLGELSALPSNGEPVTKWENENAALADAAEGIMRAVRAR